LRRTFGRPKGEEGSSLFEFAMVLPLLSMLLVGIIYGGITFYDYVTLADAVAVGARELATNAGNNQACYLAEQALLNAATNLNTSNIKVSFPNTTVSGTYNATDSPAMTCSVTEGTAQSVQATYPCSLTIPFVGINLCPVQNSNGSSFISSQTTVRIE
jgi:Flp pilus assembly protein TadG